MTDCSSWGGSSDGIKPLTETVTLHIASFTLVIPAGSFRLLWNSSGAPFGYQGTINGTTLAIIITRFDGNSYQLNAIGSPVNFAGTKNPVTVTLTIGNDTGTTSVDAEISSR